MFIHIIDRPLQPGPVEDSLSDFDFLYNPVRIKKELHMGRIEKTVFISYRRMNSFMAREAYQSLTARGYDVFFD